MTCPETKEFSVFTQDFKGVDQYKPRSGRLSSNAASLTFMTCPETKEFSVFTHAFWPGRYLTTRGLSAWSNHSGMSHFEEQKGPYFTLIEPFGMEGTCPSMGMSNAALVG